MNALEQKIQELAPGYVLTDAQRETVDSIEDPVACSDRLPRQISSLQDAMIKYADHELSDLGLTRVDIPAILLMSEIRDFSKGGFSGSWFAVKKTAEGVSPMIWIEITKRKYDFIGNLYREYLDREADEAGYNFWSGAWTEQFKNGIK